jgi:RNA polymerase sigma-70 factor, ECF subfamily
MSKPDDDPRETTRGLRGAWHRFLDSYEPLRPDLYRYCRHLTRSPWDAEDLAQDTMARAFVTLGCMQEPPPNPRAWLFRVASNLWIDRLRRARPHGGEPAEVAAEREPRAPREAAATLIGILSPQERAAVVLKDVFDLSLEEIAEALSTTVGAVKAALHRGRGKLVDPEIAEPRLPAPGVLDAFCEAFNARDVERLTALLLDGASIEVVGVHTEYGPEAARKGVYQGMLYGSRSLAKSEAADPVAFPPGQRALPESPRAELRVHRGEPLMLLWYSHEDGDKVRGINRIEVDGDRVTRLQNYFFTPDFIADLCGELGVPYRVNGYSYW